MGKQNRPTTVRFPASAKKDLRVRAAQMDTTMEALLLRAYRHYIADGEPVAQQAEKTPAESEEPLPAIGGAPGAGASRRVARGR